MTDGFAHLWSLDPAVAYLNHGSFGACPDVVLQAQARLRARMEREPVRFLDRELPAFVAEARTELARFVGADPGDLVFVPNATTGVNTVLASLTLEPGDELLTTDHEYNACRNALDVTARKTGARVVVAHVPFPLEGPGRVLDAILARRTARTRFVLVDHVTSPTALVLPVADIVTHLGAEVEVMIDGAHAPGMIPLDIPALGAAYYTGNAHKWLCAPKGAALLWVRRDRQDRVRPLAISHGWNDPRTDASRFLRLFDWTGTDDPTACLCVPDAIRYLGSLLPGGWPELLARNHALAVEAQALLCKALDIPAPAPETMIGSMAAVPLPDGRPREFDPAHPLDPLQERLFSAYGIEVPVIAWPAPPQRLIRVSAQLYNQPAQYERLARALRELL